MLFKPTSCPAHAQKVSVVPYCSTAVHKLFTLAFRILPGGAFPQLSVIYFPPREASS